jgi:hypothetical protein
MSKHREVEVGIAFSDREPSHIMVAVYQVTNGANRPLKALAKNKLKSSGQLAPPCFFNKMLW